MATKSNYQGGQFYDILTGQGKDPLAEWKITPPNGVQRVFDKEMKGYVLVCGGGANTKMQLPTDEKKACGPFSIELSIADTTKSKRRIHLSTAFKEADSTPLHARIPLNYVKRGVWMNLCFDLVDIVNQNFKGQTFRTLDLVIIHPACTIRRIFTTRNPPYDTTDDFEVFGCALRPGVHEEGLPKTHELPADLLSINQIFTMDKLYASLGAPRQEAPPAVAPSAAQQGNVHLAFGRRTAGDPPTPSRSGSSNGALPNMTSAMQQPESTKGLVKTKSTPTPSRLKAPAKIAATPSRVTPSPAQPNPMPPPSTATTNKFAPTQRKTPTPTTTTTTTNNLSNIMTTHGMSGSGGLVSVPASRQISSRARYQEEGSDDDNDYVAPPPKSSSPEIPHNSDDEYDDNGVRFIDSKVTGQPLDKEYNSSRYQADHRATSAMAKLTVQDSYDELTSPHQSRPYTQLDNYKQQTATTKNNSKQQQLQQPDRPTSTSIDQTKNASSRTTTASTTTSRSGTASGSISGSGSGKSRTTSTSGLSKAYDPTNYSDPVRNSVARITNDDESLTTLSKIASNKELPNMFSNSNNSVTTSTSEVVPKKIINKTGGTYGDRILSSRAGIASPTPDTSSPRTSTTSPSGIRPPSSRGSSVRSSTSSRGTSRTGTASSSSRSNLPSRDGSNPGSAPRSRESSTTSSSSRSTLVSRDGSNTSSPRSNLSRNQSNSSLSSTRVQVGESRLATPTMSTSSIRDHHSDELEVVATNFRRNSVHSDHHEDDEVNYDEDDDSKEYLHDDIRDESPRVDSDEPTGEAEYVEEGVYEELPPPQDDDYAEDEEHNQYHSDDEIVEQVHDGNEDEYNDDEFEGDDDGNGDGVDEEGEYADTYYMQHEAPTDDYGDQFEVVHNSNQSFTSSSSHHIDDESIQHNSSDDEEF